MKTLRRFNLKNQYYFITIVTFKRNPILLHDPLISWKSWNYRKIDFWVILPDHIHVILEINDENLSDVIHNFKIKYARLFRNKYGTGKVWQNRFWDHLIRDEKDMENHANYIHYNPVAHQLVTSILDWKESSIHAYIENNADMKLEEKIDFDYEYGE